MEQTFNNVIDHNAILLAEKANDLFQDAEFYAVLADLVQEGKINCILGDDGEFRFWCGTN